jgi:16S rRNA processing protein RimM
LSEFATIARIRRPQGRNGEVNIDLFTDFLERFDAGQEVMLVNGAERREVKVEDAWPHKGSLVLKLSGVDSISDAELLAGWEIQVPKDERKRLEDGTVYVSDLMDCKVFEHGVELGTVTGYDDRPGTPVLSVTAVDGGEILIPFATEICRMIDTARGVIEVELPEGLRELNK